MRYVRNKKSNSMRSPFNIWRDKTSHASHVFIAEIVLTLSLAWSSNAIMVLRVTLWTAFRRKAGKMMRRDDSWKVDILLFEFYCFLSLVMLEMFSSCLIYSFVKSMRRGKACQESCYFCSATTETLVCSILLSNAKTPWHLSRWKR